MAVNFPGEIMPEIGWRMGPGVVGGGEGRGGVMGGMRTKVQAKVQGFARVCSSVKCCGGPFIVHPSLGAASISRPICRHPSVGILL